MGKGSAASAQVVPAADSPQSYRSSSPSKSTTTNRTKNSHVASVLHAIAKADEDNRHEIPFDDVPPELLCPDRLDLRVWSLLVSNKTCATIENYVSERESKFVEDSMAQLAEEQRQATL